MEYEEEEVQPALYDPKGNILYRFVERSNPIGFQRNLGKTRMIKTDCPDCMKLLESFIDIPTTLERTKAVWATQECKGAHTLDQWVIDPT